MKVKKLIILAHVLQADLRTLLAQLPGMPEEEEEEALREDIGQRINLVEYDKVAALATQLSDEKSAQFKLWCEGFLAYHQQQDEAGTRKKLSAG